MSSPTLFVIVGSTRPARAGGPVAQWFCEHARAHGAFEPELIDLAEVGLPMMDEPHHPRLGQYTQPHTRAWSELVDRADAFAFVTPEYNHGPAPAIVNALAYLHAEWMYKPAGIVSYGGVSAGTRAAEITKGILTTLKMIVPPEAVHIPFVAEFIEDGRLVPNEQLTAGATGLLAELARSAEALEVLRNGAATAA